MADDAPNRDAWRSRRLRAGGVPAACEHEVETIVRQAVAAVGTPMGLIALIDRGRPWIKATVGIGAGGFAIASSFCALALHDPGVLAIGDATLDARFALNPVVIGRPHVRFYAGAPLELDGVRIGTLCVLDDQPRRSFPPMHERYLTYLAERTVVALARQPR